MFTFRSLINYSNHFTCISLEISSGRPYRSAGPLSIMISRVEVDASKLETEEDRYKEFAAEAVTEDNAEQTVDNKEQRRGLDCLQQHGVRDMSAKGHIVTETAGAEKTESLSQRPRMWRRATSPRPAPRGTPSSRTRSL